MAERIARRRRNHNARQEAQKHFGRSHREAPQSTTKLACLIGVFAALVLTPTILYFLPSPIEPIEYELDAPREFSGPLKDNTHLQKASRIFENQVLGPESLVVDGEHIYTGTADGKILDLYRGEIKVVARLGKEPCGSFEDEPTCGRPLGMRLDKEGYLIVADSYLGLFRVNVVTGDVFTLWPTSYTIGGDKIMFLNDIAISRDGLIYMTDSSTRWNRRHNRYCFLEAERTGRLIEYDPSTNTSARIARTLAFPNGVQLSKNEDFLFIVETTYARISKFHLKGDRKGEIEVLIDNLPGLPDNIRPSSSGGYWIGFATVRQPGKFSFIDFVAPRPWLRKLLTKIIPQEMFMRFIQKYGLIIEIDEDGNILKSLHDPTGEIISGVSEVEDKNGVLYLGSYNLPHLSRLYLSDLK